MLVPYAGSCSVFVQRGHICRSLLMYHACSIYFVRSTSRNIEHSIPGKRLHLLGMVLLNGPNDLLRDSKVKVDGCRLNIKE